MAEDTPKNNTSFFLVLTGLVMILLILGPLLLLVRQRQSIPPVDDQRRELGLKNLADLNAENQRILTQYHWIDKSKGVVGIPIDQAMKLVLVELQANKPHPLGPVVTPSPAVKSPPAEKELASLPAKRPAGPVVAPAPALKSSPAENEPANQPASEDQSGVLAGDPEAGKIVFIQCAACHSLEPDENKQGPSLAGIFGRKAGTVEDFNYSDANKNSGIVWDEAILRKYLPDPQSVVPGTKMTFPGLKNPKQVEDVIEYLREATNVGGRIKTGH